MFPAPKHSGSDLSSQICDLRSPMSTFSLQSINLFLTLNIERRIFFLQPSVY